MRRRVLAVAVVSAIALAAAANPGRGASPWYDLAASEACLEGLQGAVAGLPPASPPVQPVLFVYRYPRTHFSAPVVGRLAAWEGAGPTSAYRSVSLDFNKDAQAARRTKAKGNLDAEVLFRNVAATWDPRSGSADPWRSAVQGCLRAAGTKAPAVRPVPKASVATFAGDWGGHTRGLRISSAGRGREYADDGCCVRDYDMTFRILSVTGTLTRASALYRVTSFKRHGGPLVHVGQVGRLLLRNGIVTNSLTRDYFCSDPAWGATGACGA